jgi:hypothetical protein
MPNDLPALRPRLSAAKLIELAGWHGKRRWGLNIHDVYAMFAGRFRSRRMQQFVRMFDLKDSDKVLDVGGARGNWQLIAVRPHVLLVNLDDDEWSDGKIRKVKGDGTSLTYSDGSFDIAYSNSVIEHVGEWPAQVAFARELARVAPRFYVQTPNRWFFLEPHVLTPLLHFLPRKIFRRLVRYFSIWGWIARPNQKEVDVFLNGICLLGVKEMKQLFPGAEIHRERFMGMTKSIIAVRR